MPKDLEPTEPDKARPGESLDDFIERIKFAELINEAFYDANTVLPQPRREWPPPPSSPPRGGWPFYPKEPRKKKPIPKEVKTFSPKPKTRYDILKKED